MTSNIYIKLLEEGTTVYRPVPAIEISRDIYKILGHDNYEEDDELWEFKPGTLVFVERKINEDGEILVAVEAYYSGIRP